MTRRPSLTASAEGFGDGPRTDAPRTNRTPDELQRKRRLLRSPRMRPLTEYVERLRGERGQDDIPDFDPTQGGVDARVLLLLEAPGRLGATVRRGSGFISPDNSDPTAENTWRLMLEAGVDRRLAINWNVVPWYVGSDAKLDRPGSADLIAARAATRELLALLPDLRVVVLLGLVAHKAWDALGVSQPPALRTWHPSARSLNSRPENREHIRATLAEAWRIAAPA
jgi:hypothetical protein